MELDFCDNCYSCIEPCGKTEKLPKQLSSRTCFMEEQPGCCCINCQRRTTRNKNRKSWKKYRKTKYKDVK